MVLRVAVEKIAKKDEVYDGCARHVPVLPIRHLITHWQKYHYAFLYEVAVKFSTICLPRITLQIFANIFAGFT